jgi:sec-independent protein translocase protein TatA
MFNIGWTEWLVIGLVAILLFGKRLPEVGRSLGRSLAEFRKGIGEMKDELAKTDEKPAAPTTPTAPPAPPLIPTPPERHES